MKNLLLKLIRTFPVGSVLQEKLLFVLKLGYWPDFESPKTFNEKINHRKLFRRDELMVSCTDKIAVRDYVAARIGSEVLIPVLYSGESITAEQLHSLGDDIVAKPSHDSKSTEIIRRNTPELACAAAARLQAKLKADYGKQTNQFAYCDVPRKILVEKMLIEEGKVTPDDYKIFCFRQADGSIKTYVEIHENREQPNYRVSWFDANLEPMLLRGDDYVTGPFPCPETWPRMRRIAETLAADFDHVRVDLYQVEKRIYFGELTFFDGGGRTEYSLVGGERHDLDRDLGRLWTVAPLLPCTSSLDDPTLSESGTIRRTEPAPGIHRIPASSLPSSKV